jgi:hypothetical protein
MLQPLSPALLQDLSSSRQLLSVVKPGEAVRSGRQKSLRGLFLRRRNDLGSSSEGNGFRVSNLFEIRDTEKLMCPFEKLFCGNASDSEK